MSNVSCRWRFQTTFLGLVFILFGCGHKSEPSHNFETVPTDKAKPVITLDMTIAENFQRQWCNGTISPVETEITLRRLRTQHSDLNCYESARKFALARGMHLSSVDRGDKITDLRPVAAFENVTWLDVSRNDWININPLVSLSELKDLKELDLSWNNLKNLNGIADFTPNLESLDVTFNPIEDLTGPLFLLPNGIKKLSISLNKRSYEAIRRLKDHKPYLEELNLGLSWPTGIDNDAETKAFLQTLKSEFPTKTRIRANGRVLE